MKNDYSDLGKKEFNKNNIDLALLYYKFDVYFNNNGRKDIIDYINPMIRIYSKNLRPIKPLSELNLSNYQINRKNNKNCNVLIFSFHTYNLEKNLKNLNFEDLKLNIKYAPRVINKETSKAGAIVLLEKN